MRRGGGNGARAGKTASAAAQLLAERPVGAEQPALPGIQPPSRMALGGRPPGSGAHQAWRRLFLERFGSPLVALGTVMDRPIAELASELACTKLEAAEFWLRAVSELVPYIHPKLPSDLAGAGAPTVPIQVVISAEGGAKLGGGDVIQGGGIDILMADSGA